MNVFSCPYNRHNIIVVAFSVHHTQITAYILGSLYFTTGGPSSLQYSGDNVLFLQDVTATRVHLNGDISSIGSGDLAVRASNMGVLLQGGNYRNIPSGGTYMGIQLGTCVVLIHAVSLWSPLPVRTTYVVCYNEWMTDTYVGVMLYLSWYVCTYIRTSVYFMNACYAHVLMYVYTYVYA